MRAGPCTFALRLGLLALVWLAADRARASNEDDFFVGDLAAMTGGAVVASVADGSAAFYNHAGLAAATGSRIDVSAAAYALRFQTAESFLGVSNGPSQDASVTEFIAVPTQIAYVRRLSDSVTLGLGYFVPRAENALLSQRLVVADDPGPASTWAVDGRVSSASYFLSAALGLRLSPTVRLGFGLFGVYDDEVQSTAFFGSLEPEGETERAVALSSLGKASRISTAPGLGLQLDLGAGLSVGLWARGPQLQFVSAIENNIRFVQGTLDADDTLRLMALTEQVDESGEQVGFVSLGRYAAGLAWSSGGMHLSVEADVQPGLKSAGTAPDRGFAFNARAGITYAMTDRISFGAGLFSDRSTEPSGSSDTIDFYGVTLGLGFDDVLGLAQGERSDSLLLSSVFALRYAYGTGRATTLLADPEAGPDVTELIGNAKGALNVHEVSLHVGSGLHF